MDNTRFIITDVGTAAASAADPHGPYVKITEFRIGTGYGYAATTAATDIQGTALYTGTPRSVHIRDNNTLDVVCEIPPNAGPFYFGEVGLYLESGELFAIAVFPQLRQKLNAAINGTPHAVVFHALLRLEQGVSIFEVNTTSTAEILEAPTFQHTTSPQWMLNQPNAVLVRETNYLGESTLLIKAKDTQWTPLKYTIVEKVPILEVLELGGNLILRSPSFASHESSKDGEYIFQDSAGNVRMVTQINGDMATLRGTIVPKPIANSQGILYLADDAGTSFATTLDYGWMWTRMNRVIGVPAGVSYPPDHHGWGQTEIAAPASPIPTTVDWNNLVGVVEKARNHLGIEPNGPPIRTPTSGTREQRITRIARLERLVTAIDEKRFDPPKENLEWRLDSAYTRSYTSGAPWEQLRLSLNFEWDDVADRVAFFNSGGYTEFSIRTTRNAYVEWMIYRLFSMLGTIRFKRNSVESMGPMRIRYKYGDGHAVSAGPLGLQGLDLNFRKMFSYVMPLPARGNVGATGTGAIGRADESLIVELYAQLMTDTRINLQFWLTQTTVDLNDADPVTNPGFDLSDAEPIEEGRITLTDDPPAGSYLDVLSNYGWNSPTQKINIYAFTGRPSSPDVVVNWPTVTVDSANTSWGNLNASAEGGGFAGGDSSIES